jgi:NADH-ubiquinone oxidoreductase chain 5
LSNRLGDLLILLAIRWSLVFGCFDTFHLNYFYLNKEIYVLLSLIILASCTKRAQLPFSAWLPAAIAAPTPVSSLVHSSTLVTAGVYLVIRFNLLINFNFYLIVISFSTMFLSGLRALYETDLKKIIALSTLRQLGLIIFRLSLSLKDLAFFHLIRHALFKSLIFLCAGALIHFYINRQESRHVIKLSKFSNIFSVYFIFSNFSLIGFFFLAGFYSKDYIVERIYIINSSFFIYLVTLLRVIVTFVYTLRLLNMCFSIVIKSPLMFYNKIEDKIMFYPIILLFSFSLTGGRAISWLFFPLSINFVKILNKLSILLILILFFFIFSTIKLNLNSEKLSHFLRKM